MAKKRARSTRKAATVDGTKGFTIVYVHGIGNKPEESVLRCQWDHALMGFGLGERSRMAYWCQTDRHGPPEKAKCGDADATLLRSLSTGAFDARAFSATRKGGAALGVLVDELTDDAKERAALKRLIDQMGVPAAAPAGTRHAEAIGDINFPDFLTRLVTGIFLKDVCDFFFDRRRRERMKASLVARLSAGNGPFVVVAHSQGSMIAYSVLQDLGASVDVPLFLTIGSPLGLAEVRDQLRDIHRLRKGKLPTPAGVRRWVNVYDDKDPVARKEDLAPHYTGNAAPADSKVKNAERSRDPHSATGYLKLGPVQNFVREHIDLARFQRLAPFVLAADVTADYERSGHGERRPLLIELTDPTWAARKVTALPTKARTQTLPEDRAGMAAHVVELIEKVTERKAADPELKLQRLERYVSVQLTEIEAQRLSSHEELARLGLALPPMYRVWRNARKVALLDKSVHAIQASPAHQAYRATGRGIVWAVLDSGCTPHPHFDTHETIVARWDCTQVSDKPIADDGRKPAKRKGKQGSTHDHYGHGTHVAGIIAGGLELEAGRTQITGIAPHAKLHIYKVLDDRGEGDDGWIIKALDHIASINDKAGGPEIAGVNLSLGGEFEQAVFGCGHTPLCDELRRLWRQGVVVVLAAGNEGYRRLLSTDGEFGANIPCSIGDPANLDEAIAVGAVHKEKPHTYGVSHFSSRGPTADGRSKPDCVAPGEQILSCRHDRPAPRKGKSLTSSELYYKLDGTSMAAPHVSGLIACYLSVKREFIGQPERVKKILLENCTDLGRDRALQGAGLPNLVKMLVES
ncbi:MAG: S8 family serine peptidase [Planctomycetes bacterium]|nr:S8 family serine peptidase [Planctomycetota bacterium]